MADKVHSKRTSTCHETPSEYADNHARIPCFTFDVQPWSTPAHFCGRGIELIRLVVHTTIPFNDEIYYSLQGSAGRSERLRMKILDHQRHPLPKGVLDMLSASKTAHNFNCIPQFTNREREKRHYPLTCPQVNFVSPLQAALDFHPHQEPLLSPKTQRK